MHHIADPAAVGATLAEMVRVARPGGRIVVWDHNPRNPYWRHLMARVPQDDGSERLIPEAEVLGGPARRAAPSPAQSAQLGFVPDFVRRALLGARAAPSGPSSGRPGLRRLCAHNVVVATRS